MSTPTCSPRRDWAQTCVAAAALAVLSAQVQALDTSEHYDHWGINLVVVVATAAAVCLCVILHYEVLSLLSRRLAQREGQQRRRVLFAILGVLSVHIAEIWVFGLCYTALLAIPGIGNGDLGGVLDHIYISAMTFTTVGVGDAYAIRGPIRFLAGTEALTGLVLVTWSASFTYLEMARFWRER